VGGRVLLNRQNPVRVDDLLVATFWASCGYSVWFLRAVSLADNLNAGTALTAPRRDRRHDGHNSPRVACPDGRIIEQKEFVQQPPIFLLAGQWYRSIPVGN
jgi:hypothetical protein